MLKNFVRPKLLRGRGWWSLKSIQMETSDGFAESLIAVASKFNERRIFS
jgi:hypothetical protein